MDASSILVGILAAALALFLILSIMLVVYLIKIAKQIQRITNSAERAATSFENIVSGIQKAVAPAVLSRVIMDAVQKFADRRTRDKKDS